MEAGEDNRRDANHEEHDSKVSIRDRGDSIDRNEHAKHENDDAFKSSRQLIVHFMTPFNGKGLYAFMEGRVIVFLYWEKIRNNTNIEKIKSIAERSVNQKRLSKENKSEYPPKIRLIRYLKSPQI